MDERQPPPANTHSTASFKPVAALLAGALTTAAVCIFAPPAGQVAGLGVGLSVLAGLFLAHAGDQAEAARRQADLLEALRVPVALAPEPGFFRLYAAIAAALSRLAGQLDPVLRELALLELSALSEQVRSLADGRLVFSGTETWRTAYEKVLRTPGVRRYDSVAWVRTERYWQDLPGRQSMQLNFDLAGGGMRIERTAILAEGLWPPGEPLPSREILPWLQEQQDRGIRLSLVREADVRAEPELLGDFGIYGDRAAGLEELDEQARTVRFTLLFDRASIQLARGRLERLALYATPYDQLLARLGPTGARR